VIHREEEDNGEAIDGEDGGDLGPEDEEEGGGEDRIQANIINASDIDLTAKA